MATAGLLSDQSDIWWIFLLEGIAAIIFGILLLTAPAATLVALSVFLGLYRLFIGVRGVEPPAGVGSGHTDRGRHLSRRARDHHGRDRHHRRSLRRRFRLLPSWPRDPGDRHPVAGFAVDIAVSYTHLTLPTIYSV